MKDKRNANKKPLAFKSDIGLCGPDGKRLPETHRVRVSRFIKACFKQPMTKFVVLALAFWFTAASLESMSDGEANANFEDAPTMNKSSKTQNSSKHR